MYISRLLALESAEGFVRFSRALEMDRTTKQNVIKDVTFR